MASSSGFMLGLIGGLLDFASATSLLLNRPPQPGTIGGASYLEVASILYVLGVLVMVTSLFSAMLIGMRYPRRFSILMAAYGVVMVAVGWLISTEITTTAIASIYSYGMLVVGALMLVNGILRAEESSRNLRATRPMQLRSPDQSSD